MKKLDTNNAMNKALREAIEIASSVTSDLDGDIKNVAFKTVLSHLIKNSFLLQEKPKKVSTVTNKVTLNKVEQNKVKSNIDELESLQRTEHPDMFKLQSALDKSLYLLTIALAQNVDGLTPSAINEILWVKFRLKIETSSIRMALRRASKYVNGHKDSTNKIVYRIAAPGESYVKARLAEIGKD